MAALKATHNPREKERTHPKTSIKSPKPNKTTKKTRFRVPRCSSLRKTTQNHLKRPLKRPKMPLKTPQNNPPPPKKKKRFPLAPVTLDPENDPSPHGEAIEPKEPSKRIPKRPYLGKTTHPKNQAITEGPYLRKA